LSDQSPRHGADGEPTGVPFGGSPSPGPGPSSDYVPLVDLTLLSSAPLSSEIRESAGRGAEDQGAEGRGAEGEGADDQGSAPAEPPVSESSVSEPEVVVPDTATVPEETSEFSVESLLDDLERVTKERDGYLDDTRRVAAEFANFRRQNDKRQVEMIEQAAASLAERLLPVLDACDGALAHCSEDVEPIYNMLIATLEKSGLSVLRPLGDPFDPNRHEAVIHEEGDGDGPHVAEVLRTGYVWNGRVLRPALVKVRD
jgi:molecular chaperone GrpE